MNKLPKLKNITPEILQWLDKTNQFVCMSCHTVNKMEHLICQDQECIESATQNMITVKDYHD